MSIIIERGNLWSVAVVVPAQNEERTIGRCIRSVLASAAACEECARVWIVVAADTCTDRTEALARRDVKEMGEVLSCSARSVGTARNLGVRASLSHFNNVSPTRVWLAHTDADSHVPRDWISQHLSYANDGIVAVAGIVKIDSVPGYGSEVARRLMSDYACEKDGAHEHVHGANFGVRADAYLDAGGWSDVGVGEDHCLWHRLRFRGHSMVASSRSCVVTSGRLKGRARGGFADTLRSKLETIEA